MSRIPIPVTVSDTPQKSRQLPEAVANQLGVLQNMFRLDPKTDDAVRFEGSGDSDPRPRLRADLAAVRLSGYCDGQVIEIVEHVAVKTWTN